ncbi:hypothetical protein BABINDRAFT_117716 [Babjeviella inositovora NRRL Y-12698]|uniref:Uncharacterized protein n=1 Tax=Babjeviella inositovora NRRL Y-12698 TaxID=984486 RepID=A0A1E3QHQ1_9ASCO|nr:uncharacterized protein BABINDRAFT_117716 [Babjeviella inositovora NRRL Y-12698]ODQ76964.1 hypothetical protein BABINDRAFT_117716 [Babjeviella inositovora NRRL Y-12698]
MDQSQLKLSILRCQWKVKPLYPSPFTGAQSIAHSATTSKGKLLVNSIFNLSSHQLFNLSSYLACQS